MERFALRGKLRNKIFVMMALVSVVPIFIAGFLSVYSITLSHRVDVANLEGALIDQAYGEMKNFMGYFVNANGGALRFTTTGDASGDIDLSVKKSLFRQLLIQSPALAEISSVDLSGRETFRADQIHLDGVPDAQFADMSSAEGFSTAKAGKDYLGPVRFVLAEPMLTIALPAKNRGGKIISVIIGQISLENVRTILQNGVLGETGYLYAVDKNGAVIGGGLNGPAPSADLHAITMVQNVVSGQDFLGPDGERRYQNFFGDTAVAAGKFLPEFQWGLIAEWPAKEADASVNDLIYKNIATLIIVLIAVVILGILLATLIVRPIRKLEKSTESIAKGKFDEAVNIRTGDELEELGAAFNKMMAGLKELEELKNEFVFIAAHELRTPVAAMKGYLQLILDGLTGPISDKTKDFIEKVMSSNQRLIQLVNDLLEVSRSENGKLVIKVSAIDVVQPIKAVLVELASLAAEKQVQMVYEPRADLPKAMADPDRLKEVIVNLVGNSIKYMGGSGKVTIGNEVRGANLITHIADTGLGMSKEAQAKLFEKFYRVSTEKTKDIQGTGLGLFIVKEIIEKMGGTISAFSEGEGKGATFSFTLPIAS